VVDAEMFQALHAWHAQKPRETLAEAGAALRHLCTTEEYALLLPARSDRDNAFVQTGDNAVR